MAEFVKKTFMGYKTVADGQSDYECGHVVLTRDEYNDLLYEKRRLEREILTVTQNAKYSSEALKNETENRIKQIMEQNENELDKAREEIEYLNGLNKNLLRISRERANADRKLKPKKKHTGYAVLTSEEKEYRYKSRFGERQIAVLWQTVLQTPYSVEFTEEHVRNLLKEMSSGQGRLFILGKIGIDASYTGRYEDMVQDRKYDAEKARLNILLAKKLRANYRSGYWELILTHTKPLGLLPEEIRVTYSHRLC